MKKSLKLIPLTILTFILTILWASCGYSVFFQDSASMCCSCSDFSTDSFSNLENCLDDILINDFKPKRHKFPNNNDLVCLFKENFKNSFISNVWQPPKLS